MKARQQVKIACKDITPTNTPDSNRHHQVGFEKYKDKGRRPGLTNNYHNVRISLLLAGIESVAVGNKLWHFPKDTQEWLELTASASFLISFSADIGYYAIKSIRELPAYHSSTNPINMAADVHRGGLKLVAGVFGAVGGGIFAYFDFCALNAENSKINPNITLSRIYFWRGSIGTASAITGILAAYSYTGPLFGHLNMNLMKNIAEFLAKSRLRLLLWAARLNILGVALIGAEIIYRVWFMDDRLQDWCDKSVFRKNKGGRWWGGYKYVTTPRFNNVEDELTELEEAFVEVRS